MYSFLLYIFESIFPPTSEARSIRLLTQEVCRSLFHESKYDDVIALTAFNEPRIRTLVHESKFHNNKDAHRLLAAFICFYIENHPQSNNALWIPIPLSRSRYRERGYNQTQKILEYVKEKHPKIEIDEHILIRTRNTTPQTSLAKNERLKNMQNAFLIIKPEKIKGRDIIVFDDVMTTERLP